ncbi:hypothetical protein CPB83DRAFT_689479 [Crepidotus variabilis]|uniref:Uncharacterized protein n=1 Tax=Crepidotus variabilis TaxID=179855 RepID=A0A9P6JK42_9AGAR|nr:hypothetical protein CPB83DRAFT_689479 [Crepidotus variabilis]
MRGQSSIPGIARSARSPTDGPSPLQGRASQGRMPSMGQEDYQRMLLQQQQSQMRQMASASPGSFNPQMMNAGPSQQQLAAAQMQQQQQQGYGMSPGSAVSQFGGGGMTAPSPTNSQNWGTPSGYPFTGSGGNDQRHMSGTPAPGQQQSQMTAQTSPTDSLPNDLDLFNWNG